MYYLAGASRIAMRKYAIPASISVEYMLSDHLGSTSLTTDSAGNVISELRYTAWGEVRYQAGTTSTSYTYTGQYSNTADFGLMFYNAHWYDPALGRFAQADSMVLGGVQGYDRYAYSSNNPINNIDPSGHDDIPWWEITKFIVGRAWNNGRLRDSDWKEAANTYIPANHEGSNHAFAGSVVLAPLAGVAELNVITTDDGDAQLYFTYGGGAGAGTGLGVAVGETQGSIDGSGFKSARDFAGEAVQVSVGANLPFPPVGLTFDAWAGKKDGGGLSNVYGVDGGWTVGSPGVSGSITLQNAVPLTNDHQMSGFGLFVCRVAEQCGRPSRLIDVVISDKSKPQ